MQTKYTHRNNQDRLVIFDYYTSLDNAPKIIYNKINVASA